MSFLKKIFGAKEAPITSYADFWTWFQNNEKDFYSAVKSGNDLDKRFFDKLSPKLDELMPGFYYLTGMLDDNTVELVITADSNIKNMVFVEELVAAAPALKGWKFTAHKPPVDYDGMSVDMDGLSFGKDDMSFYANESAKYPDEIDITVVYNNYSDENEQVINNGVHIYLENYLGEVDFANLIDHVIIVGEAEKGADLIPMEKLKDYLVWRQKEFVEKYEGIRYDTANDTHSILEAELKSGNALIATINTELLKWDSKASHPWISEIVIKYDGSNTNGMPVTEDYESMNKMEDQIMEDLKDSNGNLYVGRQTAEGERTLWFASKDFRQPAKTLRKVQQDYSGKFEMEYNIYKDKYWQSFEQFSGHP